MPSSTSVLTTSPFINIPTFMLVGNPLVFDCSLTSSKPFLSPSLLPSSLTPPYLLSVTQRIWMSCGYSLRWRPETWCPSDPPSPYTDSVSKYTHAADHWSLPSLPPSLPPSILCSMHLGGRVGVSKEFLYQLNCCVNCSLVPRLPASSVQGEIFALCRKAGKHENEAM